MAVADPYIPEAPSFWGFVGTPAFETAKDVNDAATAHAAVYCHRMLDIKRACLLQNLGLL